MFSLLSEQISKSFFSNLINNNKLERVGPGIYKLPEYPIDNFYILSEHSKNMCYSHATSLYLHNMSDRIPLVYDVTVPYNYSGSLLSNNKVVLRYVKEDIFKSSKRRATSTTICFSTSLSFLKISWF